MKILWLSIQITIFINKYVTIHIATKRVNKEKFRIDITLMI